MKTGESNATMADSESQPLLGYEVDIEGQAVVKRSLRVRLFVGLTLVLLFGLAALLFWLRVFEGLY